MSVESDDLAELDAMRTIASAIRNLDQTTRERVLRWSFERFGIPVPRASSPQPAAPVRLQTESTLEASRKAEGDLADLYSDCGPTTDAEKTLVVSYWLQEVEGEAGVDAQSVNTQLKHLGYGVGNITRAFDKLIENRPQLMIQTKKAGTTKQARKIYRVTLEGKKAVQQMRNREMIAE